MISAGFARSALQLRTPTLHDRLVPHHTDGAGLVAVRDGHGRRATAVDESVRKGVDEREPSLVRPFLGGGHVASGVVVGVLLRPDVADVVAFGAVVLR